MDQASGKRDGQGSSMTGTTITEQMDSNPYSQTSKFVELLNSQQETVFGFSQDSVSLSSSQVPVFAFQATEEI
ncbi:hypothetical protein YC2023_083255 [Brassica napus]